MSEPVRRPGSITAAATVAMLGSLAMVFFAAMMLAAAFIEMPTPQPEGFRGPAIGIGLLFGAVAIIALATSVGLLKMRQWARTAALVFAIALVLLGAFGVLAAAFIPFPPPAAGDTPAAVAVRPLLLVTFGFPLIVGVWWLVLFNRASVRDAFAGTSQDAELAIPLSISLTAWMSIIGGAACLIPIVMRMPAFILGVSLTGWAAGAVYAFFGALSIYIGRGLLDLRERARLLCLGWYAVTLVHMALVTFVPALRDRMDAAERAVMGAPGASPMDDSMRILTFLLVVAITALVVVFLHRHRALFHRDTGQ